MQPIKRGAALLAGLAGLALLAVGCGPKGTGGATGGGGAGGGASMNGTDAVATINGEPITQADFYQQLQTYVPQPQSPAAGAPAGTAVLEQMIQARLICGLAKQEQVTPTQVQIDSQFSDVKWIQEGRNVKPFEDLLVEAGMTPDSFKQNNIMPLLCQQNLLTKGLTLTDAEIKAYYELNKAKQYTRPERAHIKRIILSGKPDADEILGEIKGGKQFEDFVARSMVQQPADGDLNQWIALDDSGGTALKPLIDAIKKTNNGETAPPVAFQGSWWLIKVIEKKPKEEASLDTVKNLVSTTLLGQKAQQNPAAMSGVQSKLREYTMAAKVDIPEKQYADIAVQLKKPPPPPPSFTPPPAQVKPGPPGQKPTITIVPGKK